jgi:hypothetical protein
MKTFSIALSVAIAGFAAGCQTTGGPKLANLPAELDAQARAAIARQFEDSFSAFSHTSLPISEARITRPVLKENRLTEKSYVVYCADIAGGGGFPFFFAATEQVYFEVDRATGLPKNTTIDKIPRTDITFSRGYISGCDFNNAGPFPEIIALRQARIKRNAENPPPPRNPAGGRSLVMNENRRGPILWSIFRPSGYRLVEENA